MDLMIYILDHFGTAVFAVSGALAAGRKRMDIFGLIVLGCVTALGGGTLRDMILDLPVFWVSNIHYLVTAVIAALGTLVFAHRWKVPNMLLMYADAVGLAVFTVIGFEKGYQVTHMYSVAIVMGLSTGVVGGIIRDVLSGEIPLILRREIYASASLCGAALLALLTYFQLAEHIIVFAAILTTLVIRVTALHRNISLPLFLLKDDENIPGNKQGEEDNTRSES